MKERLEKRTPPVEYCLHQYYFRLGLDATTQTDDDGNDDEAVAEAAVAAVVVRKAVKGQTYSTLSDVTNRQDRRHTLAGNALLLYI